MPDPLDYQTPTPPAEPAFEWRRSLRFVVAAVLAYGIFALLGMLLWMVTAV